MIDDHLKSVWLCNTSSSIIVTATIGESTQCSQFPPQKVGVLGLQIIIDLRELTWMIFGPGLNIQISPKYLRPVKFRQLTEHIRFVARSKYFETLRFARGSVTLCNTHNLSPVASRFSRKSTHSLKHMFGVLWMSGARVLQGVAGCCRVLQGVAGCYIIEHYHMHNRSLSHVCEIMFYTQSLSGSELTLKNIRANILANIYLQPEAHLRAWL